MPKAEPLSGYKKQIFMSEMEGLDRRPVKQASCG